MVQERKNFRQFIRLFNQQIFFDVLCNCEGSITIVWDGKTMMRQLNSIVTPKLLSEHNVTKNFSLDDSGHSNTRHMVYLLYPTQQSLVKLLKNWLQKLPEDDLRLHHILFVPDASYTLKQRLRDEPRVWSRLQTVEALPINWFPTEQSKLLTMDLPLLVPQMIINGDWNYLFKCATALRQLECLTSDRHLKIHCKGEWSARIVDMLMKLRKDKSNFGTHGNNERPAEFGDIVIIDRWLDPLTPMLRQFTFGGACDEFFGIDSRGILQVPLDDFEEKEEAVAQARNSNEFKELKLNDQIFEHLQDLHVNSVAAKLREIVDELKEEEQQRKTLASLAEYKNFVVKLPNIVEKRKSTSNFMRLAGVIQRYQTDDFYQDLLRCEQELVKNPQPDKVIPFIENSIIECRKKEAIIRLVVLQSIYSRGLKASVLQTYSKLFVQSYGVSSLKWILKLEIAGLIRDEGKESKIETRCTVPDFSQFANRKYRSNNFPEMDELKRLGNSIGSSILVRLIEEGLQTNWSDFATVEQKCDDEGQFLAEAKKEKDGQATLVFVVGGITRTEMSMLNQLPSSLLCCATSILNGNDIIQSFVE